MKKVGLLNFLTFLAAFLLFQIELITAKMLLPNYGGSFMVWGACMVFFQAVLLAGYAFSHTLIERIGIARYRTIYLILLVIPLFFFPGKALQFGFANDSLPISFDIFLQLLATIGPVFFVLSTVSLLTQVWLSSSDLAERKNPYALYAWSNLGSFSALLTYPFVFEFYFDLQQQLSIWRILYFLLIVLSAVMFFILRVKVLPARAQGQQRSAGRKDILLWLLLSGGGVMMFLSVTNLMTMEISPIPLLWIIPLAIYLLAFVLNFKRTPWCPSWINSTIHWTIGLGLALFFVFQNRSLPIILEIFLSVIFLFIISMYCQNQLILRKPSHEQDLTFFYFMISLGGFMGGLLTSWFIPLIFASIAEYIVGLILIASTLLISSEKGETSRYQLRMVVYFFLVLFIWPKFFPGSNLTDSIFFLVVCWLIIKEFGKSPHALALVSIIALVLMPYLEMSWENKVFIYKKRNYYGIYKVFNKFDMTVLHHGAIMHGMQFNDPAMRKIPTAYFGNNSPVGLVLLSDEFLAKKIAVVGLGAGTLATYLREDQAVDFYELDPEIVSIAEKYFSFTKDMSARGQYIVGDARVSLVKNADAKYHIIILDAFSGDSLPAHLLTKEMLNIYRERLAPGGIVLFNTSNRYLNLDLVIGRVAQAAGGKYCYRKPRTLNPRHWEAPSSWMALTWDEESLKKLILKLGWEIRRSDENLRPWTDQYTNVVPFFMWDTLLEPLKH